MTVETPAPASRDDAILAYIERFWHDRGYGPSVREIMAGCGLVSPGSTHYRLVSLHTRGLLSIAWHESHMVARSWRPAPRTPVA